MRSYIIIAITVCLSLNVSAQQYRTNNITLITKADNTNNNLTQIQSSATFSLNNATNEFVALIDIFPIVPEPDLEDSLAQQLNPLLLKLQGNFPVNNVDFLTVGDNGKMYNMTVTCNLNERNVSLPLNFGLVIRKNSSDINNTGNRIYHPTLMFELAINPDDFGLSMSPFSITQLILIRVSNAIINRL